MNKSKAAEWADIFSAYADGDAIQINHGDVLEPKWVDIAPSTELIFTLETEEYRRRPAQAFLDMEKRILAVVDTEAFNNELENDDNDFEEFMQDYGNYDSFNALPFSYREAIEAGEEELEENKRATVLAQHQAYLPAGYRFLKAGEIIRQGDRGLEINGETFACVCTIGDVAVADAFGCVGFIRPTTPQLNPNLREYRFLAGHEVLQTSDFVWAAGLDNWVPASSYAGFQVNHIGSPRACRETGRCLTLPEGYDVLPVGSTWQYGDKVWCPGDGDWRWSNFRRGQLVVTKDAIRPSVKSPCCELPTAPLLPRKEIRPVTSVNGIKPDAAGNIEINTGCYGLTVSGSL